MVMGFKRYVTIAAGVLAVAAWADVKPIMPKYGRIAVRVAKMLPRNHISRQAFDDEISQRAWTNLVTSYDYDHSVFLKTDIEEFSRHLLTIDDELKEGKVEFGYEVYNRFAQRLGERIDFATNLIATAKWDFSVDEVFQVKRKDAPWPENREAAEDFWRRRIKNEMLVQLLANEIDGKTNRVEDLVANLAKKYRQYAMVLAEPDEETVLQHYLSAVCRAYDPHTDYLSPASKEDFDMDMNLTLCGVGAVLSMEDGALKIVEIMPGGPMDRDGRIKEGDKIVGVKQGDGAMEDIMWQPMKKTIRKIRGPKDTRVTLAIAPRSDTSGMTRKLIELVRDEIKLEDQAATGRVEKVVMGGGTNRIGYVDLPGFYESMGKRYGEEGFRSCAMDVAKIVAEFNAAGVEGLILDLRGNGGGSLREAVLVSALFVPEGPVVQIKDASGVGLLPIPRGNPVAFRRPMAVLTDRASASASEIVAGCLQDVDRAIVLGDGHTHGKGTVQTVMGLGPQEYGSVKITTARFYRVNGRSTQVEGVAADLRLPSLLDALDIGEDKLTYALPMSEIAPAEYTRCWNLHRYLRELTTRSATRVEKDERYQRHIKMVEGTKISFERESVPLERAARKAQMLADREVSERDEDAADLEAQAAQDEETPEPAAPTRARRRQQDDPVLDEAFRVVAELVRLSGGAELPRMKEWWR